MDSFFYTSQGFGAPCNGSETVEGVTSPILRIVHDNMKNRKDMKLLGLRVSTSSSWYVWYVFGKLHLIKLFDIFELQELRSRTTWLPMEAETPQSFSRSENLDIQ